MLKINNKQGSGNNNSLIALGGIILVVIMFFSTIGYSFMSMDREDNREDLVFDYNGFIFTEKNGYFFMNNEEYSFAIKTDPRKINGTLSEGINLDFDSYRQVPLYYYSQNDLAFNEILGNFGHIALRMNGAFPGEISKMNSTLNNVSEEIEFLNPIIEYDKNENIPIKDCSKNNVIAIQISNESKILQKDKCVIISGTEENIIAITDEFILKSLSILA